MKSQLLSIILGLSSIALVAGEFVEAKFGYFNFNDSTMKQIYNKGGVDLQLAGSHCIYPSLHVYAAGGYQKKNGKSLEGEEKTSLYLFPLSLGLQPVFSLTSQIDYYVTLGPRYIFARAHPDSSYVPRVIHAQGIGGFTNMGFLFELEEHVRLDVFVEYDYTKLHFSSNMSGVQSQRVQVGGLTFGIGLGYYL